jgi:hypothetical protein
VTEGAHKPIAVAAMLFAASCSAPQPAVSPQLMDAWSFHPPHGWVSFTIKGPFGQPGSPGRRSWRTSTPPQILSLNVMPARRPLDLQLIAGSFFTSSSHITLCRGLPALLNRERLPFGMSIKDSVATQQAGSIAIATYYYPRFFPPDPSAEASIRSLCPRRP